MPVRSTVTNASNFTLTQDLDTYLDAYYHYKPVIPPPRFFFLCVVVAFLFSSSFCFSFLFSFAVVVVVVVVVVVKFGKSNALILFADSLLGQ